MKRAVAENYLGLLGRTVLENRKRNMEFRTVKIVREKPEQSTEVTMLVPSCRCEYGNTGECIHCGGHRDPIRR